MRHMATFGFPKGGDRVAYWQISNDRLAPRIGARQPTRRPRGCALGVLAGIEPVASPKARLHWLNAGRRPSAMRRRTLAAISSGLLAVEVFRDALGRVGECRDGPVSINIWRGGENLAQGALIVGGRNE
jgi:hypothetical protein